MNEYWNSLLTEKSWKILQELRRNYKFILIGGWAVYLFTKRQKSKDIDIIVDIKELEKLKTQGLSKNEHLKKYEIKKEEVNIDVYVEYFSRLDIPVEDIKNYISKIEGFNVACPEVLLILKQGAYNDRKDSVKGEKDKIDIISLLLFSDIDFRRYFKILRIYKKEFFIDELKKLITNFKDYDVFNMSPKEFKIKKKEILRRLKKS